MNIIIYNINSTGGNYEYSQAILNAYKEHSEVKNVTLLMPGNSHAKGENIKRILMTDAPPFKNKILRKLHFIYRSIVNPLRLVRYLKRSAPSFVIFNDFDQLTAPLWCRWFKDLRNRHTFAVMLHDPDRDKYLPLVALSVITMKSVMSVIDIAFYHGYLPDKPYYKSNLISVAVPHGIYPPVDFDEDFLRQINQHKKQKYLIGILGNIRDEKNYNFVIEALGKLPDFQLLVAGSKSSANVPVEAYKQKIKILGLHEQVIWIERFLSENELNTAIAACDIILLYYKVSFTSQSGILNLIAPYKKKLLVTNTPSALQQVVHQYKLGILVPPDNMEEFIRSIKQLADTDGNSFDSAWVNYEESASWKKNVDIAVESFKHLKMP